MTHSVSADSVLAAIDARRPGLKLAKKHLLLFFAQGHHLAHFGHALFLEPIDVGPHRLTVVGATGEPARQPTDEGQLNTIGYVVERYASLAPTDLRAIIKASDPFLDAERFGGYVNRCALAQWFNRPDETDDPDDERPSRAERAALAGIWNALT